MIERWMSDHLPCQIGWRWVDPRGWWIGYRFNETRSLYGNTGDSSERICRAILDGLVTWHEQARGRGEARATPEALREAAAAINAAIAESERYLN